uniref:Cora1.08-like protein variant 2 n=1 Tax=Corylus avellana TaxID=13451 RepID=A0AB38YAG9_CORAV
MGVITYTDEYTSPIPPARLFKALVIDAHILIPKLLPQAVKSIEIIQGDGGAGSIRQTTFAEGSQFSTVKNRIDELNEKTYYYKYTVIEFEGDALADKLELIVHEVQFEATAEGGSKNKMTTKYHTKDDVVIKEEEIKAGKEKVLGMYKVVEGYLIQNPGAYA